MFGDSYFQSPSPGCLVPRLSKDDKSLKAVAAVQGSGEQNETVSKKPQVEWCQSLWLPAVAHWTSEGTPTGNITEIGLEARYARTYYTNIRYYMNILYILVEEQENDYCQWIHNLIDQKADLSQRGALRQRLPLLVLNLFENFSIFTLTDRPIHNIVCWGLAMLSHVLQGNIHYPLFFMYFCHKLYRQHQCTTSAHLTFGLLAPW